MIYLAQLSYFRVMMSRQKSLFGTIQQWKKMYSSERLYHVFYGLKKSRLLYKRKQKNTYLRKMLKL